MYERHLSTWPTGCPRFMHMSNKERADVASKAQFCLFCLHPDYVRKRNDPSHNCTAKKRSSKYTCSNSNCTFHLWVCLKHQSENSELFKKLDEELQRKYNLRLAYVVGWTLLPPPLNPTTIELDSSSDSDSSIEEIQVPSVPMPNVSASCQNRRMSQEDALTQLKTMLKESKIKSKVRPIAKGTPVFILGYTRGRTRGLLTLYDSGCLSVCFNEGVPQNELQPAVLKCKGPIYVNGVGNSVVKVNDEWMVTVPLNDGSRAVLEGLTVDQVTANLPYLRLGEAAKAVKDDVPGNKKVQDLKCYESVGGAVDILLGIQYSNIFPEPVHTLDSGLAIYKLVIASHDDQYDSTIGGTHTSFETYVNYFGGMNIFLANLQTSLENYQKFGAPRIQYSLMSEEDLSFAREFTEVKVDGHSPHEIQHILDEVDREDDDVFHVEDILDDLIGQVISPSVIQTPIDDVECHDCGVKLVVNAAVPKDDEDSFLLKSLQKATESGLSIEYRCPRCRSCSDCLNSHETERVSLREEAEDIMIQDSIKIDWERKIIEGVLPMRGPEEEFLSNNRELGLKILQQQCKRYQHDEETKAIILKAFDKLRKNKQLVLWDELDEEDKELIESKKINHWIVWRVVFKPSLSSPARPVFDASSKTPITEDGGGRCLNDLVVKGRVVTLNLTKMVLRFTIGRNAVQGDLKQFYASIKLNKQNWNLQRVLIKEDLDPEKPPIEAVIKTLIWGIKCVSAQSEAAVIKLAEFIQEENPRLAECLTSSRFVDDIGDSEDKMEVLKKMIEDADSLFEKVGLACKGWTFSGEDPPEDVAEENNCVSIGGMKWHSKLDFLELTLPVLHFGKKSSGRLAVGTQVFEGHFIEDLEAFVPKKLSRKQILSKKASLFDILGKLTPISAKLSYDLRQAIKETQSWDEAVSDQLRAKWIKNFWMLEKLRGLKFERAKMPVNAVSSKMQLIIAGDTAKYFIKICGIWFRFKLKDGSWSCQHGLSRSLLGDEDSTTPKEEFDVLTMSSNLGWVTRNMIGDKWIDDYVVLSDSTIALCWTVSDKNRLSLFHRNRAVQVRRGTDLDKLYHCVSEAMPCDLGTRPDVVTVNDVGPQSVWEKGLPWMRGDIGAAVEAGILKPAKSLTMNKEEEESYKKGFVFEKDLEILTRGHTALSAKIDIVKSRLQAANYLFNPAKFSFTKTVRIISVIFRFYKSFKCRKDKISKSSHKFSLTMSTSETAQDISKKILKKDLANRVPTNDEKREDVQMVHNVRLWTLVSQGPATAGQTTLTFRGKHHILITDDDISRAMCYLFKKGTQEVLAFHKPEFVKKIAVKKDDILFNKSRILQGQELHVAEGFETLEFLKTFSPYQNGFNLINPVLDRFSPVSFAIAKHIHEKLFPHRGYESTFRFSLDSVYIIEGQRLFRELIEECVKCKMLRGKYMEMMMGPLPDESFTVCPPFYCSQLDIFGPVHLYVPGHEMLLRNKKAVETKVFVLVFACPVSRCVNLQVVETKSADGIIDGIIRLSCEVGVPKFILTDQDGGIMKGLEECEVRFKDLQHVVYKEKGIVFKTAPVSGHNFHGLVERKIQSLQDCLRRIEVDKMRLHATGYQTLMKLIENDINSIPFGYCYGRSSDNTPLLKLISPNVLKLGRNNNRCLEGPIKMPRSSKDLLTRVEKGYEAFYELFNTSMIPKLMKSTKWFESKDENIEVGTIVYFKKTESELSNHWSLGQVVDVTYSKDGVVRRCSVQYQNAKEDFKRTTDRAARSLIKLFHIDDTDFNTELSKIEVMIEDLEKDDSDSFVDGGNVSRIGAKLAMWVKTAKKPCKICCCASHCTLESHVPSAKMFDLKSKSPDCSTEMVGVYDDSYLTLTEITERATSHELPRNIDNLTALISCTNLDLADDSH